MAFDITSCIGGDLWQPVLLIAFGSTLSFFAVVAMPETAIHEYRQLSTNKRNIWLTWQICPV